MSSLRANTSQFNEELSGSRYISEIFIKHSENNDKTDQSDFKRYEVL